MPHLRDLAAIAGCRRLEWTTDSDNPGTFAFSEAFRFATKPTKGSILADI